MIYRSPGDTRFRSFPLRFRHTDALLGVNGLTLNDDLLRDRLTGLLARSYGDLDREIAADADFAVSLAPVPARARTPIGMKMAAAARRFGIGPMAAVAGAVAEALVDDLAGCCGECFCENGGDIALSHRETLQVSVFPGGPPFDRSILLTLPPGKRGIASSSGEFGHSFSRGQAQMVTVIADTASLADAAATAIANQVLPGCDPQKIVEQTFPGIQAILVIWGGAVHYRGGFELGFA
jgi:ApbE superfamily uncharacterized protein (UPF0280 family)